MIEGRTYLSVAFYDISPEEVTAVIKEIQVIREHFAIEAPIHITLSKAMEFED